MAAPRVTKRAMFRKFVYVDALLGAAPNKRAYDKLEEAERVKKIEFSRKTTAVEMKAKLMSKFPSLIGRDFSRMRIAASNKRGHAMAIVLRGCPSGDDLMQHFAGSASKKVFFHFEASLSQSTITGPGAVVSTTSGGASNPLSVTTTTSLTTSAITDSASTRRYLENLAATANQVELDDQAVGEQQEQHEQQEDDDGILSGNVPAIAVDSSSDSELEEIFPNRLLQAGNGPRIDGYVMDDMLPTGVICTAGGKIVSRTSEVLRCIKRIDCNAVNAFNFMTHSFEEFVWQGTEDARVMLLVLLPLANKHQQYHKLITLLKNVPNTCYLWIADKGSNEGRKVKGKFSVQLQHDNWTVLVVAPSHSRLKPQLIEILNESNFEEEISEALATAAEFCAAVSDERYHSEPTTRQTAPLMEMSNCQKLCQMRKKKRKQMRLAQMHKKRTIKREKKQRKRQRRRRRKIRKEERKQLC
ncbi:uncharacterized protein LOC144663029 isoform X1 [Oculina patagonica]